MADQNRSLHLLTTDSDLATATTAVLKDCGVAGFQLAQHAQVEQLLAAPPSPGDLILLDSAFGEQNVYELARELTGRAKCRIFVLTMDSSCSEPIAQFCGAAGSLQRPPSADKLTECLQSAGPTPGGAQGAPGGANPGAALPSMGDGEGEAMLPEALLKDLVGTKGTQMINSLTDPETNLFNYEFLNFKLDEEFKRAQRFGYPLACVMLGFEGQASEEVLRQLAGIFLQASRDTDILGRFDESSFLFLLPHTGPDGARVMAHRVGEMAEAQELGDVIGDPLEISVGISIFPQAQIQRRQDLFAQAREAFRAAQQEGGGVVTA